MFSGAAAAMRLRCFRTRLRCGVVAVAVFVAPALLLRGRDMLTDVSARNGPSGARAALTRSMPVRCAQRELLSK